MLEWIPDIDSDIATAIMALVGVVYMLVDRWRKHAVGKKIETAWALIKAFIKREEASDAEAHRDLEELSYRMDALEKTTASQGAILEYLKNPVAPSAEDG